MFLSVVKFCFGLFISVFVFSKRNQNGHLSFLDLPLPVIIYCPLLDNCNVYFVMYKYRLKCHVKLKQQCESPRVVIQTPEYTNIYFPSL